MPLLEVQGLETRFQGEHGWVRAVDGVSFEVNPGETLAIVGESGSGKSVTAMSLLRLIPQPPGEIAGQVVFDGQDLLTLSEEEMQSMRGNRIAMIFQEPMTSLNPALTVGLQVAEPLVCHRQQSWATALRTAADLLSEVQIPDASQRLRAYPHQFSGGMCQRVMIAMALACQPKLIIADEPTTALDVTVQAQVLELLEHLTRDTGSAMILITHDLGVVARHANRICVMYAGRIVESGPVEEIYANPRHPYTVGLLAAVPRLDTDSRDRLVPIEGQPPNLAQLPSGCAFHPRCSYATERCRNEKPALEPVGAGHQKACFADVNGRG